MAEVSQAYTWLYSTLTGDSAFTSAATGGVFQGYARIGTAVPYATFNQQTSSDVLTMNVKRLFSNGLYQVKAIGPARLYSTLNIIADRIDALIGRSGPVTLSPGYVLSSFREQQIQYEELVNGEQWSHIGGLYRIYLQGV